MTRKYPTLGTLLLFCLLAPAHAGSHLSEGVRAVQSERPDWCKELPRPEYKALERVQVSDAWFEVYKVAADVYAIYEPHQSEEVISYLILGRQKAILFDTGMGISDIKKVVRELTKLPILVLNSHTHDDHVGGNWEFHTIYSMETAFSERNAKGSREDAQAEIAPGEICGKLPTSFDPKTYRTRRGASRATSTTTTRLTWAAAPSKSWPRPATRPTPFLSTTGRTNCSSPATRTIPPLSGSIARKPI